MSALDNLTNEIKEAMKAKNALALEALRAIKSAVLLQKSEAGAADGMTDDQEIKLLQKLVKQRRDSAAIFRKQNRADLAEPEEAQAEIIARFLPEQLSEQEVGKVIESIITQDHLNTPYPDLIKSNFSSGVGRSSIAASMGGTTTMKRL